MMPSSSGSSASFFTLPFKRRKYTINPPDDVYNVIYLGNVLTIMGKGELSIEKPLALIWKAYTSKQQRHELSMKLTVTRSGLKAETKLQGLTEYWAHRITFCKAPADYPKIFCWVYKHDGKKMKPEFRCHAVLCKRSTEPASIATALTAYLQTALAEYKREKRAIEKARQVSAQAGGHGLGPRRKLLLQSGSLNFRPPVNRSKSAPRLGSIDEEEEGDEAGQSFECPADLDHDNDHDHDVAFEEDDGEVPDDEDEDEISFDDDDDSFYFDRRSTPLGDDVYSNSGSSGTPKSDDDASSTTSFKRQPSMTPASRHRRAQTRLTESDGIHALTERLEVACSVEDEAVPTTSSCASSDDGFASGGLKDGPSRRDPDSISDESGYHEPVTGPAKSHSDDDDEDDDDFDEQRKAALAAQKFLQHAIEPNIQVTAL